ncbi:MAG: BstXI family restriction endonuclease [Candidatus Thorarchaeota archaeon]|jgi:hypothetical protein
MLRENTNDLCLMVTVNTRGLPCMKLANHRGSCDANPKLTDGLENIVKKKIYKTMQTRGAQPYRRVPYQNRVARWNRAVVPYGFRDSQPVEGFENGFTIMVRPSEYFTNDFDRSVVIGSNAFVFYNNWIEYESYPPPEDWEICEVDGISNRRSRRQLTSIDTGHYILRLPSTTSENRQELVDGPPQGIRFFEYASQLEAHMVSWQLAYLAWQTTEIDSTRIPENLSIVLEYYNLANVEEFQRLNAINSDGNTICPLCLKPISITELQSLVEQARGREVYDLTVTEANLFHLEDIRPGEYNHRVYKVAWGHYHCNTTARDMGIPATLDWMEEILRSWAQSRQRSFPQS